MPSALRRWFFAPLTLVVACQFDTRLPRPLVVACSAAAPVCPGDLTCNVAVGRCVGVNDDVTPPRVITATLTYAPTHDNPLAIVTAAKAGTRVTLALTFDEDLGEQPVLGVEPAMVTLEPRGGSGRTWSFDGAPGATPVGHFTCALSVTATDAAGNVATLSLEPAVVVDTEPPAAPDLSAPDRVVYERIPWGAKVTVGRPRWTVAGQVQPGQTALVLVPVTHHEIGRAAADADGGFSVVLVSDAPALALAVADEAGNLSPPSTIRDVVWLATMGGKIPGRALPNPHRLVQRPVHTARLRQDEDLELDGPGTALEPAEGAGRWVRREFAVDALAWGQAVAYDAVHARIVAFGGGSCTFGGGFTTDYFSTLSRDSWDLGSGVRPSPRGLASATYDQLRERVVVFGGSDDPCLRKRGFQDTWEWDGARWQRIVTSRAPSPRLGSALSFDPVRGTSVLFGGLVTPGDGGDGHLVADTWEWNGRTWAPLDTSDAGPPARWGHTLTWDPMRRKHVLFGGTTGGDMVPINGGSLRDDTWTFDGQRWESVDAGLAPPPRSFHAAAFDPNHEAVVITGGYATGSQFFDAHTDLWELAGTWRQRSADVQLQRAESTLVYHAGLGALFSIGGRRNPFLGSFDPGLASLEPGDGGERWVSRGTFVGGPRQRVGGSAAYDRVRGSVVSYGGDYDAGTAIFDGWGWRFLPVVRPDAGPGMLSGAALAYRPDLGQVVMLGSSPATDTWAFDGTAWRFQTVAPAVVSGWSMAWSPDAGALIATGGTSTWSLSGSGPWRLEQHDGGPAPQGLPLALDEGRDTIVAYRFDGFSVAVLEHLGRGEWAARASPGAPQRYLHALSYDGARHRVTLFGGQRIVSGEASWPSDVWYLDPQGWVSARIANPEGVGAPLGRQEAVLVYDERRRRLSVFGGRDIVNLGQNYRDFDDHWELELGSLRPSEILTLELASLGNVPGTLVVSVDVSALAGADGQTIDGAPLSGATLVPWFEGAWRTPKGQAASENAAPADAPASLALSLTDPLLLLRLLEGRREVHFAVVPLGENGSGYAKVHLREIEARVKLRLPP